MKIEQDTLALLIRAFREGCSLVEISDKFNISKFRIRHALRKALGEEYWVISSLILQRPKNADTRKRMSEAAKIRNANPEWAQKVIETKRCRGYFKFQSERHKEWMKSHHPTRGKKLSEKACVNIKEARQRFYDEGGKAGMLGKTHSQETKEKLRKITRKMWADGKFTYGDGSVMRSKLEKSLFERIKVAHPDAEHSHVLKTDDNAYVFDIYIPSKHTLIEVNGNYWHFNPKIYVAEHFDKHRNVTAQQIWERDATKLKTATEQGFAVVVVWEDEVKTFDVSKF